MLRAAVRLPAVALGATARARPTLGMATKGLPLVIRMMSSESTQYTFPISTPFEYHKLPADTIPESTTATREQLLSYYKDMQTIRVMEDTAMQLYGEKEIRGFCHVYIGMEACAVGLEAAIRKDDPLISAYRVHGLAYTRGLPVKEILGELMGREEGNVGGKGGSMHMYNDNFYGGNGIVGAQVPLGTGLAFSIKYRKSDNVCFCLYGDGAANQGQVFESYNLAALWNLPVVFICENNKYGMGTAAHRASASIEYYTRGDFVPGVKVDGMDVLAVRQALSWAADYCRSGKGPLVIEFDTYRYQGHSMSDPGKIYRPLSEVKEVRKSRDPIKSLMNRMLEQNVVTKDELQVIYDDVSNEIAEIVKHLKASPFPKVVDTFNRVYKDEPNMLIRGCDALSYHPHV